MKQEFEHRSITNGGQVYVPLPFLNQIGLEIGDQIQFLNHDDYISFIKSETQAINYTMGERSAKLIGTIGQRGRIVIPKKLRLAMKLQPHEKLEISVEHNSIVFKKLNNQDIEYRVMEEVGRIYIPPSFLQQAEINIGDNVQFFNHDEYFFIKKALISNFEDYTAITGEIRKIDELGRVMIPKLIREFHDIDVNQKLQIDTLDKSIVFRKFSKDNESLSDEILNLNENTSTNFYKTIKSEGRIAFTLPVLHLLGFKPKTEVQFFIKNDNSIIVRKYKLTAALSTGDLVYTGQSRIIGKDGNLVIPKKIRDRLNINDEDNLNIKLEGEDLVLIKA
ncbi:AbrB/MazE/SpoVT family DNA-binding domain-containing protein [Priestia megaterium]|uniref:AbrB/MazE/SpoVT family DNA-binding domain-containing protein n=1 Tax=Priestia megaterium TaxID=1404 RepID=UPI002FFFA4B1